MWLEEKILSFLFPGIPSIYESFLYLTPAFYSTNLPLACKTLDPSWKIKSFFLSLDTEFYAVVLLKPVLSLIGVGV